MSFVVGAFFVFLAVSTTTVNGLQCFSCTGSGCEDTYSGNFNHQTTCTPALAEEAINGLKNAASKVANTLHNWGIDTGSINQQSINTKMVCAKVEMKFTEGDGELVTRSCASTSDKVDFCEQVMKLNEKGKCSVCDGNLCNGSPTTQYSLGILFASVALLLANRR